MAMRGNGRAKLFEETGELIEVLGKVDAYGLAVHPDGKGDLKTRLEDEIADVQAACKFVAKTHGLDVDRIEKRIEFKIARYKRWHADPDNMTGDDAEIRDAAQRSVITRLSELLVGGADADAALEALKSEFSSTGFHESLKAVQNG